MEGDTQRVLQPDLVADPVDITELEQRPAPEQVVSADDGLDRTPRLGVDLAERRSLAVGDEQVCAVGGQ